MNDISQFLQALSNHNTARAYRRALRDLISFAGDLDSVNSEKADAYLSWLRDRGDSSASINLARSACSTFYSRFRSDNPFAGIENVSITNAGHQELTVIQLRALMNAPDITTVSGSRIYAMMSCIIYAHMGSADVRSLRLLDIQVGAWVSLDKFPAPCWAAVNIYLDRADREVDNSDLVFVSERGGSELSGTWLNNAVKQCSAEAGLPEWINARTLRYATGSMTALELARAVGYQVSSERTTQVPNMYLNAGAAADVEKHGVGPLKMGR
jgi:site-specific recombinase XerD